MRRQKCLIKFRFRNKKIGICVRNCDYIRFRFRASGAVEVNSWLYCHANASASPQCRLADAF